MEVVGALSRRQSRGEMTTANVRAVLKDIDKLEMTPSETRLLAEDALRDCGSTSHDAMYVALAQKLELPLCTLEDGQVTEARRLGVRVLVPGTPDADDWPP
jgi:predicted nucleic acid-binding protein